jgi:hypothetical protein
MLDRFLASEPEIDAMDFLRRYLRGDSPVEEFIRACRSGLATWKCPCGVAVPVGGKCGNLWGHLDIQTQIRVRFTKGQRVFYNYHAYPPDCPAIVIGYVSLEANENGTYPWAWIRLKFDHLKANRSVPIWSEDGCCLSEFKRPTLA